MLKGVLMFIGVASLAVTTAAFGATRLEGTFALQGGTEATSGYLEATPGAALSSPWNFDFWLTKAGSAAPIASYDVDMSKLMHVIVVSDDFTTFMHEHPAYASNGHFSFEQNFPQPGAYHVYFDGRPTGFGQQVFRFDVTSGSAPPRKRDLGERSPVAHADGYTITLSSLSLRAGAESQLTVRITKGGKPAGDLHPYLQALGHAVLIDSRDLSYVHVHPAMMPGAMPSMGSGDDGMTFPNEAAVIPPNMLVHVTVTAPGTYKMWFQFRGGSALHVATFVLTAS